MPDLFQGFTQDDTLLPPDPAPVAVAPVVPVAPPTGIVRGVARRRADDPPVTLPPNGPSTPQPIAVPAPSIAPSPFADPSQWGQAVAPAPAVAATPPSPSIPGLDPTPKAPAIPGLADARSGSGSTPSPDDPANTQPANGSARPDGKLGPIPGIDPATSPQVPAGTTSSGDTPSLTPAVPSSPNPTSPPPPDKPYDVDEQGNVKFQPGKLADGLLALHSQGGIDSDKFKELYGKAQDADKAYGEQQRIIAENPAAWKAFVAGGAKGIGFLAGAAPGAAVGAEVGGSVGSIIPGLGTAIGAGAGGIIGGLVGGTAGSFAVDKSIEALGKHSETIQSFADASKLHPYYDAAGNLVSFAGGLPNIARKGLAAGAEGLANLAAKGSALGDDAAQVTANLSRIRAAGNAAQAVDAAGNPIAATFADRAASVLQGTANNYSSAGGLLGTIDNLSKLDAINKAAGMTGVGRAVSLGSRVGGAAAGMVAIDTAIKEGGKALGINPDGQTVSGALQAALIGAFASGHNIAFDGTSSEQLANIVTRAGIRTAAGLNVSEGTLPPEAIPKNVDILTADALKKPLTEAEAKLANSFLDEVQRRQTTGEIPPNPSAGQITDLLARTTGRQASTGGKTIASAVDIAPEANGPAAGPAAPGILNLPGPTSPASPVSTPPGSVPAVANDASESPTQTVPLPIPGGESPNPVETRLGNSPYPNPATPPSVSQAPREDLIAMRDAKLATLKKPNLPASVFTNLLASVDDLNAQIEASGSTPAAPAPAGTAQPSPVAPSGEQPATSSTVGQGDSGSPQTGTPSSTPPAIPGLEGPSVSTTPSQENGAGTKASELASRQSPSIQNQRPTGSALPVQSPSGVQASEEQASALPSGLSEIPRSKSTHQEVLPEKKGASPQPSTSTPSDNEQVTTQQEETQRSPSSATGEASPQRQDAERLGQPTVGELPDGGTAIPGLDTPAGERTLAKPSLSEAYQQLTKQTGYPDVKVSALAEATGQPVAEIHQQLRDLWNRGLATPAQGDMSLADESTRNAALDLDGTKYPLIRLDPEALTQPTNASTTTTEENEPGRTEGAAANRNDDQTLPGVREVERGGTVEAETGGRPGDIHGSKPSGKAVAPYSAEHATRDHLAGREDNADAIADQGVRFHEVKPQAPGESPQDRAYREQSDPGGGIHYDRKTRTIVTDANRLAASGQAIQSKGGNATKWNKATVSEEVIHDRQQTLEGSKFEQTYAHLWNSLSDETKDVFKRAYPDATEPFILGAEYERAKIQRNNQLARHGEGVTEGHYRKIDHLLRLLDAPQPAAVEKHLAAMERLAPQPFSRTLPASPDRGTSESRPSQTEGTTDQSNSASVSSPSSPPATTESQEASKERFAIQIEGGDGKRDGEYTVNATEKGLQEFVDKIKPEYRYRILSDHGVVAAKDYLGETFDHRAQHFAAVKSIADTSSSSNRPRLDVPSTQQPEAQKPQSPSEKPPGPRQTETASEVQTPTASASSSPDSTPFKRPSNAEIQKQSQLTKALEKAVAKNPAARAMAEKARAKLTEMERQRDQLPDEQRPRKLAPTDPTEIAKLTVPEYKQEIRDELQSIPEWTKAQSEEYTMRLNNAALNHRRALQEVTAKELDTTGDMLDPEKAENPLFSQSKTQPYDDTKSTDTPSKQEAASPDGQRDGQVLQAGSSEPPEGNRRFTPDDAEEAILNALEHVITNVGYDGFGFGPSSEGLETGGIWAKSNGEIQYNLEALARSMSAVDRIGGNAQEWLKSAFEEEVWHRRDFSASPGNFRAIHRAFAGMLSKNTLRELAKVYGEELPDSDAAAEYLRMLGQRRSGNAITESHLKDTSKMEAILDRSQPRLIEAHLAKMIAQASDDQELRAANPSPTISDAASKEQQLRAATPQTQTPAFKDWFKDSKVVGEDGEPLVVYHGTKSSVESFQPSRGGEYGSGIYLTDNADTAGKYAAQATGEHGENILPVYASIQNPYLAKDRNVPRALGVKGLKKLGYDGIIATGATGEKQYIAFAPEQIKSATGNNGDFDPNNPSILRAANPTVIREDARAQVTEKGEDYKEVQADNATVAGPATFQLRAANPLTAYHGTPHDVDKFSLDKVGTGEGNQVYGFGLYFAQAKATAEAYAQQVKGVDRLDAINKRLSQLAKVMAGDEISYGKYRSDVGRNAKAEYEQLMEERAKPGNVYSVHLDAEPDELLDWDKPLNQQGEKVKVALQSSGIIDALWREHQALSNGEGERAEVWDIYHGDDAYKAMSGGRTALSSMDSASDLSDETPNAARASQRMAKLGILGIRYLDQGSRGDKFIVKANDGTGDEHTFTKRSDAEEMIRDFGMKSATIEDAPGTSNFVMFDDSRIKITHKNGEPVSMEEASATKELNDAVMDLGQQLRAADPFAAARTFAKDIGDIELPKAASIEKDPATAEPSKLEKAKTVAGAVANTAKNFGKLQPFTRFDHISRELSADLQINSVASTTLHQAAVKAAPDLAVREAATVWSDLGGDKTALEAAKNAAVSKPAKARYERALDLKGDELKYAEGVRDFFKNSLPALQEAGVVGEGRANYINRIVKEPFFDLAKPEEADKPKATGGSSGQFSTKFRHSLERQLPTLSDVEQAGFKVKTYDSAELMASYQYEAGRAILTRKFANSLKEAKAQDGRPLADKPSPAPEISPRATPTEIKAAKAADRSDYMRNDNLRALNGLGVHPEVARKVSNILGTSAIRDWLHAPTDNLAVKSAKAALRGIEEGQQIIKQTMYDFSPFHYTTEGLHATGHLVNPFGKIEHLDLTDKEHVEFLNGGLMVAPTVGTTKQFEEGLTGGSKSLVRKIPGIGKMASQLSDLLFHSYIPNLKIKTARRLLAGNLKRFKKEMDAGELTRADVVAHSMDQANAAYGHMNYTAMARNPTVQHVFGMAAGAPDFLEARFTFTSQAARGVFGKSGREQLKAMAILLVSQMLLTRLFNKLFDDDYHWNEPFSAFYKGRSYTLRSVPEDIWKAVTQTASFLSARESPALRTGIQLLTGRNYRGERTDAADTLREAASGVVPISVRDIPGLNKLSTTQKNSTITAFEQVLSACGFHVARVSPENDVYALANSYKKSQGIKEDTGSHPVSKFQPLKYALQDQDMSRAKSEWESLVGKDPDPQAVQKAAIGFRNSIQHPFTQSREMDQQFAATLKGGDRENYDKALAMRQDVLSRFREMIGVNSSPDNTARARALASLAAKRGNRGLANSLSSQASVPKPAPFAGFSAS